MRPAPDCTNSPVPSPVPLSAAEARQSCVQAPGARDGHGYARVWLRRDHYVRAHRLAYEEAHGAIPDGLVIDHLCHNTDPSCGGGRSCLHRGCIEPTHLEAVTPALNTSRGKTINARNASKTHCDSGHEFTPENTYQRVKGGRTCRECQRGFRRAWYQRQRQAVAS